MKFNVASGYKILREKMNMLVISIFPVSHNTCILVKYHSYQCAYPYFPGGPLILYFICQFWGLPIQQQIKITSKLWTHEDTIISYSRKHCGEKGKKKLGTSNFSFFHSMFKRLLLSLLFVTQPRLITTLRKKPYENIVGKGENAFTKFSIISYTEIIDFATPNLPLANAFNLAPSKILSFGRVNSF